jgi:hypothetical protein
MGLTVADRIVLTDAYGGRWSRRVVRRQGKQMEDELRSPDRAADTVSRKELYSWLSVVFLGILVSNSTHQGGTSWVDAMFTWYLCGLVLWCLYKLIPPGR